MPTKAFPSGGRWQSEGLTDEVRPDSYSCCGLKRPTSSAPSGHLPQRGRPVDTLYDGNYNEYKMSPTSISGGRQTTNRRRANISRLVRREASPCGKTPIGRFCLRQNLNNGVIIHISDSKKRTCMENNHHMQVRFYDSFLSCI